MSFKEVLINTSQIFTHLADEHDFLRSDKSTSPLSPVITAQHFSQTNLKIMKRMSLQQ